MAIAFLPFYIDRLGLEAYGLIGFFAVMQSILALFDLGFTPTLTREAAGITSGKHALRCIRDLVRSIECIAFAIAIVLVLGICAFANTIAASWVMAEGLSANSVAHAVRVMSFVFAARLLEGIYRGILIGFEHQVSCNILNAGVSTIRYVGALVVLNTASEPLNAFFVWQAAISLISLATISSMAYAALPVAKDRVGFSLPALQQVWRFSAGMTAVSVISLAVANVDKFLLSGLLPLDEFGQYSLASVAASSLYTLIVPITLGVYPRLVANFFDRNLEGASVTYGVSSQLAASVTGSAGLCLAMFSMEVIYVWSGDLDLAKGVSPILKILAIAALANCFGHLGSNLQQAKGATLALICAYAFALSSSVVLLPWVTSQHGAIGAAYVWCAITSMQATITLINVEVGVFRGQRGGSLVRDLFLPILGAGAVASCAYIVRPDLTTSRVLLGVFLAVTGGGAVLTAIVCTTDLRVRFFELYRSMKTQS